MEKKVAAKSAKKASKKVAKKVTKKAAKKPIKKAVSKKNIAAKKQVKLKPAPVIDTVRDDFDLEDNGSLMN